MESEIDFPSLFLHPIYVFFWDVNQELLRSLGKYSQIHSEEKYRKDADGLWIFHIFTKSSLAKLIKPVIKDTY